MTSVNTAELCTQYTVFLTSYEYEQVSPDDEQWHVHSLYVYYKRIINHNLDHVI
jgi:hypothetical protein